MVNVELAMPEMRARRRDLTEDAANRARHVRLDSTDRPPEIGRQSGDRSTVKTVAIFLVRRFYWVALSIWLGGFTLYSAVVIPILHDHLGAPFEVGLITRRVTHALNAIGGATLLMGWLLVVDPSNRPKDRSPAHRLRFAPLAVSTLCLAALVVLHVVMDAKLDTGRVAGFYSWHRAYLWMSTVQWLANLALLLSAGDALSPFRETRG
jgi:Domain of unknown function (DUF4149)